MELAFYSVETLLVRATTNLSTSCLASRVRSWAGRDLGWSEERGGQLESGSAKRGRTPREERRGGEKWRRRRRFTVSMAKLGRVSE